MLDIVYPLGYILSALGLMMWFFFLGNKPWARFMSKIFLAGFFLYLLSLAFSEGEIPYKLMILSRDMGLLAALSIIVARFRKNKTVFFLLLALTYLSFHLLYMPKMQQAFPQGGGKLNLESNGELLLELKEDMNTSELDALAEELNFSYRRAFYPEREASTDLDDYYVIDIPDDKLKTVRTIQKTLRKVDIVESVEDNEMISVPVLETQNIQPSRQSFGINDPDVNHLWGFEVMEVAALYKMFQDNNIQPKKKALIAILDTGVDGQHEDIKERYRSVRSRYDDDPHGHGTHCAGIAASVTNNGIGIASFAPSNDFVEITSVKVLKSYGGGSQKTIIDGIIEAADRGAAVISMSLGGPSRDRRQVAYRKAIEYATEAGAIVVCAAGNNNGDARNIAPANAPGVITVSAVDRELQKASFSNFVQGIKMAVAAPGVEIYSTIPDNNYKAFNGTSMATPYVAGLIGLMKSIKPELTTKEAFYILDETGKGTKASKETGKLIVPFKALGMVLE